MAMVCGCLQWFIRRAGGLAAKGRKKGSKKGGVEGLTVWGAEVGGCLQSFAVVCGC